MTLYQIEHYLTADGQCDVYLSWLRRLRSTPVKVAIIRRVSRVELGNFGDHKFCRDGVWELRIDVGPGYRVYYALSGRRLVVLLCGGDKRTQTADVAKAAAYWQNWQRRLNDEKPTP